jgi:hypothetical protein
LLQEVFNDFLTLLEDIDDNFVMRQYMLSQGNPSQLMRLSALGEGGQGKKSE